MAHDASRELVVVLGMAPIHVSSLRSLGSLGSLGRMHLAVQLLLVRVHLDPTLLQHVQIARSVAVLHRALHQLRLVHDIPS